MGCSLFSRLKKVCCPCCKEVVINTDLLRAIIHSYPIVVFSDSLCERCYRTKEILDEVGADYALVELDLCENGWYLGQALHRKTGIPTLPIVYIRGNLVGGAADMYTYKYTGKLTKMIQTHHQSRDRERFFLPNCHTVPKPPRCFEIPGRTKFPLSKQVPFRYRLQYNSVPKRLNKMLSQ